ncbi:DUF6886 family protein [Mucilaginibacter sp.]|uniref:DUF6886 family protein n=1 Tax=Mucilaginibacter sp. TaxID=1882438 RepID=UPI003D0C3A98
MVSLKRPERLFHVSEESGIKEFIPRPSLFFIEGIKGDVVFAITESLLHNYLLPRNCPRVTFYQSPATSPADKERFMGGISAGHVIIVESGWYEAIRATTLYCYEFSPDTFSLIDECAGYYISYEPLKPVNVKKIENILPELLTRDIELRFTPSLIEIAAKVSASSLNFSLIRMRNAKK